MNGTDELDLEALKTRANLLDLHHPRVGSLDDRPGGGKVGDSSRYILDLREDRRSLPLGGCRRSVFEERDEDGFGNVSTLFEARERTEAGQL